MRREERPMRKSETALVVAVVFPQNPHWTVEGKIRASGAGRGGAVLQSSLFLLSSDDTALSLGMRNEKSSAMNGFAFGNLIALSNRRSVLLPETLPARAAVQASLNVL